MGQNGLPDNWTKQILEGEGQMGLDQAGVVLESRLNPDLERPLSQRMLDALQWFGEAVRDPSPSTRVIKYVTALERLTLTKKVDDIAESVSERVAALTTGLIKDRGFEANKAAFWKVYAVRSDLAHGTISPNDPKVLKFIGDACDYSEAALRRALFNLPASAFRNEGFVVNELDHFFDELIDWMKAGREVEERNPSIDPEGEDNLDGNDG